MSKRTSYGKIYRPDVRGRCSDVCARMRFYRRTDFTVRAGKNPSARTQLAAAQTQCVRANTTQRPLGQGTSARTQSSVRTNMARPHRCELPPCGCIHSLPSPPLPPSLPPHPPPLWTQSAVCADADARKKIKK
jgi:hypothetical protein